MRHAELVSSRYCYDCWTTARSYCEKCVDDEVARALVLWWNVYHLSAKCAERTAGTA